VPGHADDRGRFVTIVRDPLWNNIPLDEDALRLVDTAVFQRLRYVRQLGLAFLVYPGATHSRFEHALGTYHLAGRTLALLRERGELARMPADECAVVRVAALLHDLGHYPFSHALEEIGALHHEAVARSLIMEGEVADVLASTIGPTAAARAHAIICCESDSPLQGLISGSLDLDKIEYLKRDALMCGVPYGEIDVERLLHSLTIVGDPATGAQVVGLVEKGLAALESLLFAKYQMYRNVYWHHAVRSATAMYKRLVDDALRSGAIEERELAGFTDEGLLHRLEERAPSSLIPALRNRRLHKRAFELSAAEMEAGRGDWIAADRARVLETENELARELGVEPGAVLLDYPVKPRMLGLDIPVRMRSGEVRRIGESGWPAAINLPLLSQELYESTRVMRVFAVKGVRVERERVMELLES
jgi:HD superfamily phosphohydrolase